MWTGSKSCTVRRSFDHSTETLLRIHPDDQTVEEVPEEFDEDELAAYAEECALQEDLEAFADEIFDLGDFDEIAATDAPQNYSSQSKAQDADIDMCS